jgi:predicted dienelactone hydrolase
VHQDAIPAEAGPFPLVAFSHGNSGLRRQSTFLTTHLASWGIAVCAPDHSGNTFFEMIQIQDEEERKRVHFQARRNRPADLAAVIERVLAGSPAWPAVDAKRLGVMGHSYGGWTSMKMPRRDARVRAVCGLAPASEPFVGRKAFEPGEIPFERELPVLIVAGVDDVLVDLDTSVKPLFDRMKEPRALLAVEGSDHFHFCDGVEILHGFHQANPRDRQPRPTKAYAEELPEERIHRILRALVTYFFCTALSGERDPFAALTREALADLDPAALRLDAARDGEAA